MTDDRLHADSLALAPTLSACRRDLHRHPELAFEEHRTAALVADRLQALGLEVHRGVARTGVVGILRSGSPGEPAVLLRADMDALPVQELSDHEYRSTIAGAMHACGHDGHTAMLLGAASLLAARRADLPRDVVLCFQPAEEVIGGARAMVEAGLLDRFHVGSAFAVHLWSPWPAGTIGTRTGALMASADMFAARIAGRGGHGALPHQAADPVLAACQAVVHLQSIVSRSVDPLEPAVITVGTIRAGHAPNVIPDDAVIGGTIRAFDRAVRELLRRRLREVLEGTARAGACRVDLDLQPGCPAVVNDPAAVAHARRAAARVVGDANVREMPPMCGSEDFAFFLERVPGAFLFIGAGSEARGLTHPHHSPNFDIDESGLTIGTELLARLAIGA